MADPRFYSTAGPFSLGDLARIAEAELGDGADADAIFTDVQPLSTAGTGDISFLDNMKYADSLKNSRAGACIVRPGNAALAPAGTALVLSDEPYRGYARIAAAFYPPPALTASPMSSAYVDDTATIGDGSDIGAGAMIGAGAEIGRNCRIGSNAVVGSGVVVGDDCFIGAGVSLAYCLLGNRITVHAGARIGQEGFGFALGAADHLKVPQLGRVLIEDDVDIGANTTIDRGTGPDTVIGAGTKIDNLVQIAHNVTIGKNCVVVSMVGISGSTTIGNHVMIGGQVGIAGHLVIGDGAQIAAQSGVMRDIGPGSKVGGSPAKPMREWFREVAWLQRMASGKDK